MGQIRGESNSHSWEKMIELRTESLVEVTYKNVGELVTSADIAFDNIIRDAIASSYPEHGILSEENSGGVWAKRKGVFLMRLEGEGVWIF